MSADNAFTFELPPEARAKVERKRAERRTTSNGRPAEKLRRLDLARMVREDPPPVPWVIEGLVVRGMLTVLNGREGEGKSLLTLALAAGVASGEEEAGLRCEQGRVAIVDAENGEREIHRRVRTLDLPPARIEVFEAQGFDLRSDLGEIERALLEHRPDLLVLDSYRTLWGGEENDSGEVARVLDPIRNLAHRLEVGVLMLHHSGRANGAYRGSSAIGASAELGFKLARVDDDEDPERCFLECWKCRPAQKPPRRWLRLAVQDGRVFIDQAEPPVEEPERERPAPRSTELNAKLLEALPRGPWKLADLAREVGEKPKNRTVRRVLEALERDGAARHGDDGLWYAAEKVSGVIAPSADDTVTPDTLTLQAGLRRCNELAAAGLETEAEALYASLDHPERQAA